MSGKKAKTSKAKDNVPVEEKVSFSNWFARSVKAKQLQPWQEKEISVFFKQKGLTNLEEPDKYTELLKLY